MTPEQLLKLFVVALIVAALWYVTRRLTARNIEQLRNAGDADSDGRLFPESLFKVTVTDDHVRHDSPNGESEELKWSELQQVEIHTTDEGPSLPDVFLVLIGKESTCRIAQGATGEPALLERLQQLPGFDNEKLIDAMGSTSNERFVCWQRG